MQYSYSFRHNTFSKHFATSCIASSFSTADKFYSHPRDKPNLNIRLLPGTPLHRRIHPLESVERNCSAV
jgi:hypothetical protein